MVTDLEVLNSFDVGKEVARAIANLIKAAEQGTGRDVDAALEGINLILLGSGFDVLGVEGIKGSTKLTKVSLHNMVALYIVMEDDNAPTVIYDIETEKFYVISMNAFVKKYGKKYKIP